MPINDSKEMLNEGGPYRSLSIYNKKNSTCFYYNSIENMNHTNAVIAARKLLQHTSEILKISMLKKSSLQQNKIYTTVVF